MGRGERHREIAMNRLHTALVSFTLTFLLGACGGSGGDGGMAGALLTPTTPPVPEPETQVRRFAPVNGRPVNEAFLDGYLRAIAGPVDYWDGTDAPGTRQHVLKWRVRPKIVYGPRLAELYPLFVEYLRFSVADINSVLRRDLELSWGGRWNGNVNNLSGLIIVDLEPIYGFGVLGAAAPISNRLDDGVVVVLDEEEIGRSRQTYFEVFFHEMIHALGLMGHVPSGSYGSDELMDNSAYRVRRAKPHHYLALTNHYSPDTFGGWEGDFEELERATGHIVYTVRLFNDKLPLPFYGIPRWSYEDSMTGTHPSTLRGSSSWRGGLVGYTSAERFVEGTSALDYHFGANRLSADFTWDGGGSARYPRVEVGSLGLLYAQDPMGTSNGLFFGPDHDYVGGSLDRIDVTAAFGAERQ